MGTILSYLCFAALGFALVFALVVGIVFAVAAAKKSRTPTPPPMVARAIAPAPEPVRYQQAPTPNFEDIVISWKDRKREEKRRADEVAQLEVLYGIADVLAKAPGVAAPNA